MAVLIYAGPRGFEPRSTVLETGILPLNYEPFSITVTQVLFYRSRYIVGEKANKINLAKTG
jgi:hypothetical protein